MSKDQMMARLEAERSRYVGALDALRHRLEGFDAAVAVLQGGATVEQIEAPHRARLAAPTRRATKLAKKPAKTRAAKPAADQAETNRDERIAELWRGDKTAKEIAAAIGISDAMVYYVAKKLGLPARRGKRAGPPAAPKAARDKPAAEPDPKPRRSPVPPAAVAPPPVSSRPAAARTDDAAAIAAHIAAKGVTRQVDFGPHQAVVDSARALGMEVLRLKSGFGQPSQWSLNGAGIRTADLYSRVNAERGRRGLAALPMPKDTAAA